MFGHCTIGPHPVSQSIEIFGQRNAKNVVGASRTACSAPERRIRHQRQDRPCDQVPVLVEVDQRLDIQNILRAVMRPTLQLVLF